jgi:hypothetical protein
MGDIGKSHKFGEDCVNSVIDSDSDNLNILRFQSRTTVNLHLTSLYLLSQKVRSYHIPPGPGRRIRLKLAHVIFGGLDSPMWEIIHVIKVHQDCVNFGSSDFIDHIL